MQKYHDDKITAIVRISLVGNANLALDVSWSKIHRSALLTTSTCQPSSPAMVSAGKIPFETFETKLAASLRRYDL